MSNRRIKYSTGDNDKIAEFLFLATPIVNGIINRMLKTTDCYFRHTDLGIHSTFLIKHKDKEIRFHVYNLFYEIATIDRDENPLRFDEKLSDFSYFMNKTNEFIASKLGVLFKLLLEDDLDQAIENIAKMGDKYERIRIWKVEEKE